jgi:hypothetical protein
MSTVDTVFLIITACALSLFFILAAVLAGLGIALVAKVKKVIAKAEGAIDSVEAATATIKSIGDDAKGPFAAIKVVKSIIDLVNKHK